MKKNRYGILIICQSLLILGITSPLYSQNREPVFGHEARMKSWEMHMKLRDESPFKGLKWRVAGPEFMGGRIEAIACHPDNPSTIYIGPGSGNLWKTTNHGTTWKPIFDDQSVFAMGCVAIAPSDPDIIWAGTGEVLMARSSYSGLGVFKSDNAGETWQNMGLEGSYHVPRIVIDPDNPDIVYVAALGHNYSNNEERGVYKTTDGGKSWDKVLYISDRTGIVELVMDPSDNQILYAVSWERERKAWNNVVTGKESGIYKTTDGGKNWKSITRGLPKGAHLGRIGLAIAPTNPEVLYSILDNQGPHPTIPGAKIGGELYRSDNGGGSWVKTHEGPFITGIGYDFCLVRVSPDNEDEVFVPGWKLVHSTDGGKTFNFTGDTVVHLLSHDVRVMHLDMHDLWIDPVNPDRLLLGNDGGFYCSRDRGNTWLHYNNLPIGEFYAVSVDNQDPYHIYGGTQDNAALYGPAGNHNVEDRLTEYGVEDPWKHVYLDRWGGGDSYFTEPDPTNSFVIYYEHQFGDLRRKNMKTGLVKSIQPKSDSGETMYRYNWMTPYIISHHDPYTLYYGAHKMFKSENQGDDWECISPDLSTNPGPEREGNVPFGTITSISESSLKQGMIYVGTDDGNIQITMNDGETWKKLSPDLPEKWVSRVRASLHELNTVYATFTGYRDDDFQSYIYMSTNAGETWTSISGNLPPEPVNVIVEDPRDPNILYIGTDLSAYVSLNRGRQWISLSNHLPTCAVHDLVIQERDLDLVAGTHGRSIFVLDIEKISAQIGARESVLIPEDFRHYIDTFNVRDNELYKQYIPNDSCWDFLAENIPLLDCPDKTIERTYYFRWWTYRKHIRQTPEGFVITEFLPDVSWSGKYNTISCPAGHHIYEGRWLRNPEFVKSYCRFWTTPEANPRRYSFWIADAMCQFYKVHPDQQFVSEVFPSLESIFREWNESNKGENGLYWQLDDRDGMEFSIGSAEGRNYKALFSDTVRDLYHTYYSVNPDYAKQYRPTINSYMFADAKALSCFAELLDENEKADHYGLMATTIQKNTMEKLWDREDGFFKVLHNDTSKGLVRVKEEVGFVPWAFYLPEEGCEGAWKYLMDSSVFFAEFGITTADMQHPLFMYPIRHECLWNGYVWPFASAQTLKGMANLLKDYSQDVVSKPDYVQVLHQYASSHFEIDSSGWRIDWIDESQNPFTGAWHTRDLLFNKGSRAERGKDYNHSSYVDLIITGLCGVTPQLDNTLEINPLIPENWEYLCLDKLYYKDHDIRLIWDKTGNKYHKGRGLLVFVDHVLVKQSDELKRISIEL